MAAATFQALVVRESPAGVVSRAIETRRIDDLPAEGVLVRVRYSSLNYKDALSATGHRGVTRSYPHTPGVDAAGVRMDTGAEVIVTGHDLGMNTPGGFGEFIRVPPDWLLSKPAGLTLRECMILGTAGFTAAQCVARVLAHGATGDVLVTGATGGVGCLAVALLAERGCRVVAATGKADAADWLRSLGAAEVIERRELLDVPAKPLLPSRWGAAVDTVGGAVLAAALRATAYRGIVVCCGNVGGAEFAMSVYPFILRGVTLAGIDSAACPLPQRREIWDKLAGDWKLSNLDSLAREIDLAELDPEIDRILAGAQRGRVVARVGA